MSAIHPIRGVLLMLGASVSFCVMSSLIRYAADIDSYKVAMSRFVIGLGLLGTAALFGKIRLQFVHGRLLFLRGLFGGAAVFCFYLSIARLGIGKGSVIFYSYPIFAAVFSGIFLKERIGMLKAVCVATALAGIMLLSMKGGGIAPVFSLGKFELIGVAGAALAGMAIVIVKKLHDTDSTYAIFFAQCAIGLWLVIVPANVSGFSIGYAGGIVLLGIGLAATAAQLLMTEGYRHVNVTTGSLFGMLLPVLNFIIGMVLFNERLSWHGFLGAAVVILSCAVVIVSDGRNRARPRPDPT